MSPRPYSLSTNRGSGWRAGDEPALVAEEIDIADVKLRKFIVPLTQARRIITADVDMRFETETDPEGHAWAPWADTYKGRGELENVGILEKQPQYHRAPGPQLREAATDESNYDIESRPGRVSRAAIGGGSVALIGSSLPEYWVTHQYGKDAAVGYTHRGEAYKSGGVPARPFLGVSDEAEGAIYEVFDMHVERSLVGMVGRSGQPIVKLPGMVRPQFASHFVG